jgi:hypothetical protein
MTSLRRILAVLQPDSRYRPTIYGKEKAEKEGVRLKRLNEIKLGSGKQRDYCQSQPESSTSSASLSARFFFLESRLKIFNRS